MLVEHLHPSLDILSETLRLLAKVFSYAKINLSAILLRRMGAKLPNAGFQRAKRNP